MFSAAAAPLLSEALSLPIVAGTELNSTLLAAVRLLLGIPRRVPDGGARSELLFRGMRIASHMACWFPPSWHADCAPALARYAQLHSGTSSYSFTAPPTITITATHGHAHGAHADPLG